MGGKGLRSIQAKFDVVVFGAGSTGSAAAAFLADVGWSVAMLDLRPLAQAGARWVNAIPYWFYDAVGVQRPVPPEDVAPGRDLVMLSVHGKGRSPIRPAPAPTVDMSLLVDRLQARAQRAGVRCFAPVHDIGLEFIGERPTAVSAIHIPEDEPPRALRLEARLFVDATGLYGFLRGQVPSMQRDCPRLGGRDLCEALQEDCELSDASAAQAFLAEHDMVAGDVAAWVGVQGGFSTAMVHIHEDLSHVGFLVGVSGDGRNGTALELMQQLKKDHPFAGKRQRSGGGMIPVRRPFDRLAAPGVVLIGDAGCQVFPAHASGVGMGLLAARTLADVTNGETDPGAPETVWAYATRFLRTHGPILGAFDVFRRLIWDMPGADVQALTDLGFVGPELTRMALSQRLGPLRSGYLARIGRGALRRPGLAARMAALGPRMAATAALYKAYPSSPDPVALARWSRALGAVSGADPDITEVVS